MTISPNLDAMSRPAHLFTPPGCHSLTAGAHSQCSSVQYTYTHMHAHCKHYSVKVTFVWLYSSFSVYLTGEYYTTKDIVAFPSCACELQHSLSICGLQYVSLIATFIVAILQTTDVKGILLIANYGQMQGTSRE